MGKGVEIVILAAGLGTRMKSNKAKVLHEIHAKPMVLYVLEAAARSTGEDIVLVVGHQAEQVKAVCAGGAHVKFAHQKKQRGTGHAVRCAMDVLSPRSECIVILCGDVPLLKTATIDSLIADHRRNRWDLSLLAVEIEDPSGYGRVQMDRNRGLQRIVEESDATPDEKDIKLINAGIYCVERRFLASALNRLTADNAQGEYYLTDIVAIGYEDGKRMGVVVGTDVNEVMGVNNLKELEKAAQVIAARCGGHTVF